MAALVHGSEAPQERAAGRLTRRVLLDRGGRTTLRHWREHHQNAQRRSIDPWRWRWAFSVWSQDGNESVTGRHRRAASM